MKQNTTNTFPVSCNVDCGAGCPLLATTENDKIIRIRNNPAVNNSMITGCIRGFNLHRVVHSPDRLKTPLIRDGERGSGKFRKVSWEDAINYTADKLTQIKEGPGTRSILRLGTSGACRGAIHNTVALTHRFLSCFGKFTDTSGSYSEQATSFALELMFGTEMIGFDSATLDKSHLIILWGANVSDNRFGSDLENWIRKRKNEGIPVIVIDPRRSTTAKRLGTEWIPIFPGTDTSLMAAILFEMIRGEKINREFIAKYSTGFSELEQYVLGVTDGKPKTPAWAASICGLPEDRIKQLAVDFSSAKPAVLISGLSIQRTLGGEETARFAVALQLAAGNIGVEGGAPGCCTWAMMPVPYCGMISSPKDAEFFEVPVYNWADAVLQGKSGGYPCDIKAIYSVGSNYLVQGSDIKKNIRAMKSVDFSVCHELFLTPTAKHCDVVFPSTSCLERDDIITPASNHLFFSNKVIDPLFECKNDYDIFCELSEKLGFAEKFSENRSAEEWLDVFINKSVISDGEAFKRSGIFNGGAHRRIGLKPFIEDPLANPLPTPSGKIEISGTSQQEAGLERYPVCRITSPGEEFPLRLITPHPRYRINSSNGNIPWFLHKEEQALLVNPVDAEKRNILDGQTAAVYNEVGRIHIKTMVSNDIMPGVVCLPQGIWPVLDENKTDIAGSPNMLTSTIPTEPSKGARTHSVFVEITVL